MLTPFEFILALFIGSILNTILTLAFTYGVLKLLKRI